MIFGRSVPLYLAIIFAALTTSFWILSDSVAREPIQLKDSGTWKIKPSRIKINAPSRPKKQFNNRTHVVCKDDSWNAKCNFNRIADAVNAAHSGDTVLIHPGIYSEAAVITVDHLKVKGVPGAEMRGVVAEGKAALVIKGDSVLIEGLECSGISLSSGNGACLRLEGKDTTINKVYFHDSDEGILGGHGSVVIKNSRFERLGARGQAHGVYVTGDELSIRCSKFLSSKGQGHEIKTRTAKTVIEDNTIASLNGHDSRLIDIANGGEVVIRRNLLEMGPNSVNSEIVGIGYEGTGFPKNSVLIEHNLVIIDRKSNQLFGGPVDMAIRDNTIVGGHTIEGNQWYPSRSAAKIAPYPALPAKRVKTLQ